MIAHRIQQQPGIAHPGARQEFHHHLDDFGVHRGRFRPDRLRANLEELPVAPLLRTLAAEHRADVVELLYAGTLVQPMLDVGANHRGGVFRTQRERGLIAIRESVHFLGDDVRLGAYSAREKLRLFENRRTNLVIVIRAEDLAGDRFHTIPHFGGRGQ